MRNFIFVFLLLVPLASADLIIEPTNIKLGTQVNISATCPLGTTSAFLNLTGPNTDLKGIPVNKLGETYRVIIGNAQTRNQGDYTAYLTCVSLSGHIVYKRDFHLGLFSLFPFFPSIAYPGEQIAIQLFPEDEDIFLSEQINFTVLVDGLATPYTSTFTEESGWTFTFVAPYLEGSHLLTLESSYKNIAVSKSSYIQILNPVQFHIEGISSQPAQAGQTVNILVKSTNSGAAVRPSADQIYFDVNYERIQPNSLTYVGYYILANVTLPESLPISYFIDAYMNLDGYVYSDSSNISNVRKFSMGMFLVFITILFFALTRFKKNNLPEAGP